jgi:apolipoprotein D and lipocalin family protein
MNRKSLAFALVPLAALAALAGCASGPPTVPVHPQVDLQRFMGTWYVIGNIPTRPEREAFNAVEHYALDADGKIRTTFQYRKGGFDAPLETMNPVGKVRPGTNNAVWGMQFIWPIQAEYVISHVDADYRETIIARSKRDYAWIMARTPTIPAADLERMKQQLVSMGYSLDKLRIVPQQWPETGPEPREQR